MAEVEEGGQLTSVFLVTPYWFEYHTTVKKRWEGKSVREVFETELKHISAAVFESAMMSGKIRISDRVCSDSGMKLRHDQVLKVSVHRHEAPILISLAPTIEERKSMEEEHSRDSFESDSIVLFPESKMTRSPIIESDLIKLGNHLLKHHIIHHSEEIIVIDKPGGLSVHSTALYGQLSLQSVMQSLLKCKLFVIHRLDRLTSGVLIFGKTKRVTTLLQTQFAERRVQKEYIARVKGDFRRAMAMGQDPSSILHIEWPIGRLKSDRCRMGCTQSESSSPSLDPATVKPASTSFRFLRYNSELDQSVILALPHSGRTHQIRAHLQALGHPIQNDPIYHHIDTQSISNRIILITRLKCIEQSNPDTCHICCNFEGWLSELPKDCFQSEIYLHCRRMTFDLQSIDASFIQSGESDSQFTVESKTLPRWSDLK